MAHLLLCATLWFINSGFATAVRLRPEHVLSSARGGAEPQQCRGWPGSGVCIDCTARLEGPMGQELWGTCHKCPEGYVLMSGPLHSKSHILYTQIRYHTHCARLFGEERRLIVLRHGESKWNELMENTGKAAMAVGFWLGSDSPLSRFGVLQAQRLASVLVKAHAAVYKDDVQPLESITKEDDFLLVVGARSDLSTLSLEESMIITNTTSNKLVSDDELVEVLSRSENREELDALLGRKCNTTNFVSSQLVRSMDTLLIATLESRLRCDGPWHISSNLQEIEHNSDCSPKSQPGLSPVMATEQRQSYIANGMPHTEEYIEARYNDSDVSRYVKNFGQAERARWFDQSDQMSNELKHIFESDERFTIWGGHSIWFRHFFSNFGNLSDPICTELANVKMANTAMVSVRLRQVEGSSKKYAAFDCKYIYLGSSEQYKMKSNLEDPGVRPAPSDFDRGVQQIMGWKCCCSRATDLSMMHRGMSMFTTPNLMDRCVLAVTDHCSQPSTWQLAWPVTQAFVESFHNYSWGHNKGTCIVEDEEIDLRLSEIA